MRFYELVESKSKLGSDYTKDKVFSDQVKATDKAKKIPVAKWGTKHPFNGKLVGGGV
jgi:hypothetical protein